MPSALTHKQFIARLRELRPDYALVGTYAKSSSAHRFRHATCGAAFSQTPKKVLAGTGKCPCEHLKRGNSGALQSTAQFNAKLEARRPGYRLLQEYAGVEAPRKFRHSCGATFEGAPVRVLTGVKSCACEHASPDRTLGEEEFLRGFRRDHGARLRALGAYRGLNKEMRFQCRSCGRKFLAPAGRARRMARGRPALRCRCEMLRTGPDRVVRDDAYWSRVLGARHGDEYRMLGRAVGASPPGTMRVFRHAECGARFEARLDTHGVRCPCKKLRTPVVGEEEHRAWLAEHRPDVECTQFSWEGEGWYRHGCGHEWQARWRRIRETRGCPECDGPRGARPRITLEELRARVAAVDETYEVLEHLPNALLKSGRGGGLMRLRHTKCGHEYDGNIRAFEAAGDRCTRCYGQKPGAIKFFEINGRVYRCMGHEPQTLQRVFRRWPKEEVITSHDDRMLVIKYRFNGKRHNYTPDVWIPRLNMLIEVKSKATLGLIPSHFTPFGYDHEAVFSRTQAKARECIRRGYTFVLHLYGKSRLLKIPSRWMHMSRKDVAAYIGLRI